MATQNKMDMSLEDIISLNRRQSRSPGRGRGRGRGARGRGSAGNSRGGTRGRSFGRGQRGGYRGGRGRSSRGGSAHRRPGGLRGGRGAYIQNQRQVSSVETVRTQQYQTLRQQQRAARSNVVDLRRGLAQNQQGTSRGRGRKRLVRPTSRGGGQKNVIVVRGRGRGRRGGSTIALLTRRSVTGRGGQGTSRGRGNIQRVAQASISRARLRLMVNRQMQRPSFEGGATFQRGRGNRRGRGRGRGRGFSSAGMGGMQVAIVQQVEEEPEGVELSPGFAADQHTTQSLNSRFSPRSPVFMQPDRIILSNGRAVNYQL